MLILETSQKKSNRAQKEKPKESSESDRLSPAEIESLRNWARRQLKTMNRLDQEDDAKPN